MKPMLVPLLAAFLLIGCQAPVEQSGHGGTTAGSTGQPQHFDSLKRTYHLRDLQRETLKANGHEIKAWVMDTPDKRSEGMMWLDSEDVSDDDGMIFVFDEPAKQSFWMKNTILALDIIYISKDKKVLNIQPGQPGSEAPLPSKGEAKFVLELKRGSAKRLGIMPGTIVAIPASVKSK
jgi:uncharacterized membrane protein (UPF0127 family)